MVSRAINFVPTGTLGQCFIDGVATDNITDLMIRVGIVGTNGNPLCIHSGLSSGPHLLTINLTGIGTYTPAPGASGAPNRFWVDEVNYAPTSSVAMDEVRFNAAIDHEKVLNVEKTTRIGELEDEVKACRIDIGRLEGEIRKHLTEISSLGGEVKACRTNIERLEGEIGKYLKEISSLQDQVKKLQEDVTAKANIITTLQNELQQNKWVLDGVRQDLSSARESLAYQQRVNQSLESSLNSERYTSSSLRNDVQTWRGNYESAYSQVQNMNQSLRKSVQDDQNLSTKASHINCVQASDVRKLVGSNNKKLSLLLEWNRGRKARGGWGSYQYKYASIYGGSYATAARIEIDWEEGYY
ncbi:hypothetical protein BDZ97DRAFT_1242483 [Flammula alnicola]|nr:hypothetical protein BDZ97DRAFT_1242483 [Flammula alnicola]